MIVRENRFYRGIFKFVCVTITRITIHSEVVYDNLLSLKINIVCMSYNIHNNFKTNTTHGELDILKFYPVKLQKWSINVLIAVFNYYSCWYRIQKPLNVLIFSTLFKILLSNRPSKCQLLEKYDGRISLNFTNHRTAQPYYSTV